MILTLLGLIPGAMSLIQGVTNKLYDAKVQITMSQLQCDRDKAVAAVNERIAAGHDRVTALQAIAGSTMLTYLFVGFATPLLVYFAKCVLWDTMLGLGSTPALHGQIADWSNTIIWSLFGSATSLGVASMFTGRK